VAQQSDESSMTTQAEPRTQYMLTTVDNPFDPFTQFDQWFAWDITHGYHSAGLLARVVITSSELSEADQAQAIQDAIEEIVDVNPSGMHRRVAEGDVRAKG